MPSEAIELICKTEEEAHQAKMIVQQDARRLVEDAERAGKEKIASTLARADAEIAHLIRMSDQRATQQALELASSNANRQATLRARAERRLDAAAQLIVERIVNL